ncbi:hypothetical protein [Sinanaerobacter chloroacetimidivorans]|uniref:Uncharacterized protein n=1 Tax=Sinanaerobacter chloroacetimidivorans TaxID=2818044 RepID=A0A8J7W0Z8_9FIRM|nr:hypothetical protein [Sinanaerobacter chloroacetimidivorans]MBR0596960.1 hypothetical protein [Sinanaerobacter chloroacetimidivorans]
MSNIMANREVCDLTLLDYATKKPFMYIDYANVTTNENQSTSVFAKGGKGAPRRIRFDGEKVSTLTLETQMITPELIAVLAGSQVITGQNVFKRKVLVSETISESTSLTFPAGETPIEGTLAVYPAASDCMESAAVQGTLSANKFTFTTAAAADGEYVCYYQIAGDDSVKTIQYKSDSFPKEFVLYGDTVMKGEDGSLNGYQLHAYKAQPQGSFKMGFQSTGDPGTFSVTFDLLADADKNILDYHLIEA